LREGALMPESKGCLPEVAPVPVLAAFPRSVDLGRVTRGAETNHRGGLLMVANVGGQRAEVVVDVTCADSGPAWVRCDPANPFALDPQEEREVFLYPESVEAVGDLAARVLLSCPNGSPSGTPDPEVAVYGIYVEPVHLEWVDGGDCTLDFGALIQGEERSQVLTLRRTPGNNLPTVLAAAGAPAEGPRPESLPPWLVVSEPTARGKDVQVTVTLHTANLPHGPLSQSIQFHEEDPSVEPLVVRLHAEVLPAPDLEVDPEQVSVAVTAGATVPVELRLRNIGAGELPVSLVASAPWLTVNGGATGLRLTEQASTVTLLVADPGGTVPKTAHVTVTPSSHPRALPVTVSVTAEPLAPKLVTTNELRLEGLTRGAWAALPVGNEGNAALELEVTGCPAWLRVRPRRLVVPPSAVLELLYLRDGRRGAAPAVTDALTLTTNQRGAETVRVAVHAPAKTTPWVVPKIAKEVAAVVAVCVLILLGPAAAVWQWRGSHDRPPLTQPNQPVSESQKQRAQGLASEGEQLVQSNELPAAEAKLLEALKLDARCLLAHHVLAWLYARTKRQPKAIEHFRAVASLDAAGAKGRLAKEALDRLGAVRSEPGAPAAKSP